MAAVVPISRSHAMASGLRYKVAASALAAAVAMALFRLTGLAPGAEHPQNPPQQSRFSSAFPRQLQSARVTAVVLKGSTHDACVMTLGKNGKLSVGSEEESRDTIVSLSKCDLYNASREAGSTRLLDGANLNARNIFLSGGYELLAGSVMIASRYLTTHTSSVADPYVRL